MDSKRYYVINLQHYNSYIYEKFTSNISVCKFYLRKYHFLEIVLICILLMTF